MRRHAKQKDRMVYWSGIPQTLVGSPLFRLQISGFCLRLLPDLDMSANNKDSGETAFIDGLPEP